MTTRDGVLAAADDNFVTAWTTLASASPKPGRHEEHGIRMISTGAPVPLFNPAFATAPPDDVDAAVAAVVAHYLELGSPFVLYCRDETAPGLADAAAAAGLIEHFQPPLMVLDPLPAPPPSPPDGLDIVVVDGATIDDYVATMAAGFGMPLALAQEFFGVGMLELPGFTAYLGLVDGTPVATSGTFVSGEVAGVYNVATLAEHRGRGYGAALTWAAATGGGPQATLSILQSSKEGQPVYERMGFVVGDRYRQFEPPAS